MTPPPEPSPNGEPLTANLPAFLQPPPSPRSPRPATPTKGNQADPQISPSTSAADTDDSPSADQTPETPADTSSLGSTKKIFTGLLDEGVRAGYEVSAKELALAASGVVEARLGSGTGAMLMLEDEANNIAAPASRLAARHIPMPGGAGAVTDLGDTIQLVVAIAGYMIRGFARRARAFAGNNLTGAHEPAPYNEPEPPPPPAVASWPGQVPAAVVTGGIE